MLEVVSESPRLVKFAIRGRYSSEDGHQVLDLLEKYTSTVEPPTRYYFDLSSMTEFGLGYQDVMKQARRTMQLRFSRRVVFAIYTTSAVTRGFATVFSRFIDTTRLKLVVSDDLQLIDRELRA
jgi:hypothetical protein